MPRRKADPVRVPVVEESPVGPDLSQPFAGDAGASLYKDRSGPHRGQGLSEGRDNFAAITNEARKTVEVTND